MLIYFAAPLFCEAERRFNRQLTDRLEAAGFEVFLPQRDGLEEDRTPPDPLTQSERRRAIFELDTTKILACDIFLFVLDGRVPDEGACVELGIAYAQQRLHQPAKRLIGLYTDRRAAFLGAPFNPMVAGPLQEVVETEDALLEAVQPWLSQVSERSTP